MASENTPLVLKCVEEFPAGSTIKIWMTIEGMSSTYKYRLPATWQSFTSAPAKKKGKSIVTFQFKNTKTSSTNMNLMRL